VVQAMQERNDPCGCGSGKKYKKCCLLKSAPRAVPPTQLEISQLVTLFNSGNHAELEKRALVLTNRHPDFGIAWKLLGGALYMQGKDALPTFEKAAALLPGDAETHFNLGVAQRNSGQLNGAVASYRWALAINPDYAEAHSNLGNVLKDLGQLDHAVRSYRRALELKPADVIALGNLLSCRNYAGHPASIGLVEARHFGELVARQARPYATWPNVPDPARGLNIGLVSGDFREHAAGFFMQSVLQTLALHASGRLKFFAYSNHSRTDAVTARIKTCCHNWRSVVGLSDQHLAQQIRDDGIDILFDLSGHTAHNRLPMFAWKPAPVQVSWLGYFATTGVSAIDYLIADPWTLPVTDESNFTEKIWRLPETRMCFTPPDSDVAVSSLPALTTGHITFGCFNNLAKMNDAVVALWSRILLAQPNSHLFLKANQLAEPAVRNSVAERFGAHGIGLSRLVLEGPESRAKYLAAYQRVDIALDPFPYPGGATSVEALWMAVPVLTMAGDRFLSRQGVGLLMNAGLPEWIATDPDDYVARAEFHARDLSKLAELRSRLRSQVLASPIFDAPRFARHFEFALRQMWARWCHQQSLGNETNNLPIH
jgi:predicted O-linked N-acetylglucosamine transferase (SPINDLY family)